MTTKSVSPVRYSGSVGISAGLSGRGTGVEASTANRPSCVSLAVYGGEALIVAGDQDRRATFTQETADCLPGGRFVMIEGADHMGAFADPRFVAEVQAFLAEWSPL